MSTEPTRDELLAEHDELLNQMAHFETWKEECPMSWDVHGYERVKDRLAWVEDKLAELIEPSGDAHHIAAAPFLREGKNS